MFVAMYVCAHAYVCGRRTWSYHRNSNDDNGGGEDAEEDNTVDRHPVAHDSYDLWQ